MNTKPVNKVNQDPATRCNRPLSTNTLFAPGERELTIVHNNTEYRLRITALGKLILTK
jgi:hemin uptake protein HemP